MKWCYATFELSIPLDEYAGIATRVGVDCGDAPCSGTYHGGCTGIFIADTRIHHRDGKYSEVNLAWTGPNFDIVGELVSTLPGRAAGGCRPGS